jgi:hypothetical protein
MKLPSPASSAPASLGWKQQHAELDTVARPPQRSSTEEADIFYSADRRARYHHLQERFSSLLLLLQVDQKQWQVLVVAHCAAVVVVVGAMVVGMHACAPALAADMTLCPEVASKESAGFFGDVGDIQSGFASVCLCSLSLSLSLSLWITNLNFSPAISLLFNTLDHHLCKTLDHHLFKP